MRHSENDYNRPSYCPTSSCISHELGLVLGVDNDVLLVSESTLIITLPSDLRNWECLTYDKGNYEQLRQGVAAFFETNYHFKRKQVHI